MRMASMIETRRRFGMLVEEAEKRVEDEDAGLHTTEELFSPHKSIGNAKCFMVDDVG